MIRSLFRLACAGLFLAGDVVLAAAETAPTTSTFEAASAENHRGINHHHHHELRYVDIDTQSRRKDWDVFGVLLMMIHSECGPHGEVHLPDCKLLQTCRAGTSADCATLCGKKSDPGKSKYRKFCSGDGSSSSSSSSAATSADAYNENTSPGQVVADGSYSVGFQSWMLAVALSIGIAAVAVRLGQRSEIRRSREGHAPGGIRGSVNHRVGVVSDLMDSVLSQQQQQQQPSPRQVEMSGGYRLEGSSRGGAAGSALV